MGHAIFIFGPAGSGKSTFCKKLVEHGKICFRQINLINFDPAQIGEFEYLIDIRDYITTADIMEECDYGPNGSLIVAFDELYKNLECLELEEFVDEYLVFDCPGQIELFMHTDVFSAIINYVSKLFRVGILYFIESHNIFDTGKFMSNLLCGYITMYRFDVFFTFIMSKVDLVGKENVEDWISKINVNCSDNKLHNKILEIVSFDYKMLDYKDEESINDILYWIDMNLQYYDDVDAFQDTN